MNDLPTELLIEILSFLKFYQIFRLKRVNKKFNSTITKNDFLFSKIEKKLQENKDFGYKDTGCTHDSIINYFNNKSTNTPLFFHVVMECDEYSDIYKIQNYYISGNMNEETIYNSRRTPDYNEKMKEFIGVEKVMEQFCYAIENHNVKYGADKCLMIPNTIIYKKWVVFGKDGYGKGIILAKTRALEKINGKKEKKNERLKELKKKHGNPVLMISWK